MLERWERTSGAQFEAAKISFIHLTRYKLAGRDKVKILGVTLSKELRFKVYLTDKVDKATKIALALRRIKRL